MNTTTARRQGHLAGFLPLLGGRWKQVIARFFGGNQGERYAPSTVHPPDLITVDPEILGGTPVFRGTRVPVKTLFEYLEDNYSLEEFIECFPSVPRELACRVLERSEAALLTAS
jgi:uncharacterized protein (DUF433 family)